MIYTRPKFFSEILYHISVKTIIDSGFWSPVKTVRYEFDDSEILISGVEYDSLSLSEAITKQGVNNNIYLLCKKLLSEGVKSILLFTDSVATALKFEQVLEGCKAVTHKTSSKDALEIERQF